uniref:Uncharacterized protein n=1 Tax=Heterorhabditis bacteriophora TaxID=37862 RepID=A0A1I7WH95_HETBA
MKLLSITMFSLLKLKKIHERYLSSKKRK